MTIEILIISFLEYDLFIMKPVISYRKWGSAI